MNWQWQVCDCTLERAHALICLNFAQADFVILVWLQQANKGAKNHAVIMPDANPEATASALVGAALGAAGQRCMAISAAVFVGGIGKYKEALISKAKELKVSAGHEPGCDVGPLITAESKKRVEDLITSGIKQVHSPYPWQKKTHLLWRALASSVHLFAYPPLTHSPTHPLTHSRTHPLIHTPTHALTHSPTHPLTHSPDKMHLEVC